MSVQIPEKKPSLLPVSSKDGDSKNNPESLIASSMEAVKAGTANLEQEGRTIMLEADSGYTPPSSDQAVLSSESKDREVTPEQRKNKIEAWTLEELAQWAALLGWMPVPGAAIETELDDLFKLYQMLLEAVLTSTQGQGQMEQLGRLDAALSSALNRMLKQEMAGLNTFFETNGTKSQLNFIKASVYRIITGKAIPETELERFWQAGARKASDGKMSDGTMDKGRRGAALYEMAGSENSKLGNSKSEYKPLMQQGTIYHAKGKNIIQYIPAASKPNTGYAIGGQFKPSALGAANMLCTAKDLQCSEQFLQYFTGEGNLLKNEYLNGRNEEVLGVLLSVTSIKCQEFCAVSGITAPMRTQLLSVTDQMIDYFMQYAERDLSRAQVPRGKLFVPLEQRVVYKIYYEILELYQRYGRPEKAILEGIRSAVRLFCQKKADGALKDAARYSDEAGFFHNYVGEEEAKKASLREDLKEGKRILEKDWREFMKQIGKPVKKTASLVPEEQSFWGMLVEPEEETKERPQRNYISIILMALGVSIAFLLMIWLF